MTVRQLRALKALAMRRGESFDPTMSRAAASRRISELQRPRQYRKGSRALALKKRCPRCGAKPNQPCRRRDGRPRKACHAARHEQVT